MNTEFSTILQQAAAVAHGITNPVDLAKWTSNSVRVGACVDFNEAGAEPLKPSNTVSDGAAFPSGPTSDIR